MGVRARVRARARARVRAGVRAGVTARVRDRGRRLHLGRDVVVDEHEIARRCRCSAEIARRCRCSAGSGDGGATPRDSYP